MLRRPARLELELRLKRSDGALAVPQQLEDAHASRMPEHPEEGRFDLVHGARRERHAGQIYLNLLIFDKIREKGGTRSGPSI